MTNPPPSWPLSPEPEDTPSKPPAAGTEPQTWSDPTWQPAMPAAPAPAAWNLDPTAAAPVDGPSAPVSPTEQLPAGFTPGSAAVPARYEPPSVYEPQYSATQQYSAPAYGPPPQAAGYGYPGMVAPMPPTNGLAIASLVLSLVALGVGITAPIGAILGHVAKRQIRERGEGGEGLATAGIIVGWILTAIYGLCCGGLFIIPLALAPLA